jgi:hypothetical protein
VRTSGGPSLDDGRRGLCPAGAVVPREGSLLLPFDAEWRQVSGYTEPEDYAPHIATRLVRNIREHVRAHEPSQHDDRDLPARAEQHAMLLEVLGREGQVEQQAPNRYVVRRGEGDDLTVLVTPDQWEQVIRRHGLRRASLLEHFDELLASPPGRSASSSTGRVTSRPRRGRCCLPPRGRSRRYARPGAGWPGAGERSGLRVVRFHARVPRLSTRSGRCTERVREAPRAFETHPARGSRARIALRTLVR